MKTNKAFVVRLYPTAAQIARISRTLGCARFVYNHFLARRGEAYKSTGKGLSYGQISRELTALKQTETTAWLREVDKFALQQSLVDLERAFKNFFRDCKKPKKQRRFGYPNFKKKGAKQSYRTNFTNGNIEIVGNALKLPKLGWVKFLGSQVIAGRVINVTVRKNPAGKYFASILCEVEVEPLPQRSEAVGLDLGLKSFLVGSEGEVVGNPRHYRAKLRKLRRAHRILSRRQKGSHRQQQAKTKLAQLYERISNLRRDFLHKESTKVIRKFGVICIEDLRPKNMVKNRSLAQGIMDASWGEFRRQLEYKSRWYGRSLVAIDPFFPSSQLCSECGFQNQAVKDLAVREWTCPACGVRHDRDVNAAKNIKNEGLRILAETQMLAAGSTDSQNARREGVRPAAAGSPC